DVAAAGVAGIGAADGGAHHRRVLRLEQDGRGDVTDAVDRVVALAAVEGVGADRVGQHVVARASEQRVVAAAAEQHVVAGAADQGVVAGAAGQDVVAVTAVERVVAAAAGDRVVAGPAVGLDGEVKGAAECVDEIIPNPGHDPGPPYAARRQEQRTVQVGGE